MHGLKDDPKHLSMSFVGSSAAAVFDVVVVLVLNPPNKMREQNNSHETL